MHHEIHVFSRIDISGVRLCPSSSLSTVRTFLPTFKQEGGKEAKQTELIKVYSAGNWHICIVFAPWFERKWSGSCSIIEMEVTYVNPSHYTPQSKEQWLYITRYECTHMCLHMVCGTFGICFVWARFSLRYEIVTIGVCGIYGKFC